MDDQTSQYLREKLPALLQVLQGSDVRELDVREGEAHVRVRRAAPPRSDRLAPEFDIETAVPVEAVPPTEMIVSPLVGTFYRATNPGMEPFVGEGAQVNERTVVGIVEALHVLTDVEAGCSGVITKALATDGQPVEYGQALFEVSLRG